MWDWLTDNIGFILFGWFFVMYPAFFLYLAITNP